MKLHDGGCFIFLILLLAAYSGAKHEKDRIADHCAKHPHGKACQKT